MHLVIFDMDGTVIDTINDIHTSLLDTLSFYGFPHVDIETSKTMVGSGMRQLVINAVGEANFKDEMETHFRAVYKEKMMDTTCVMDGFMSVLEHVRKADIKAVILSNKIRQISDDMVNHFKLTEYFDQWFGGDSFGVKKPSPVGVSSIIAQYGIESDKTLMVGDSYTDILAGADAGAKTCFCTYGYGNLKSAKADYTADTPVDLIKILEDFCA